MPKLIYIKASAAARRAAGELIARIQADDTAAYVSFDTADELEDRVAGDLATLLAERFDAVPRRSRPRPASADSLDRAHARRPTRG